MHFSQLVLVMSINVYLSDTRIYLTLKTTHAVKTLANPAIVFKLNPALHVSYLYRTLNRAYAGLRHAFVLSTKPRFGATCSLKAKLRLGGENKRVT